MMDWMTIEAAPKDGRELLLSIPEVGTKIGFWYNGPHPAFSFGAKKDRERGLYPRWAYWPTSGFGDLHMHVYCDPTHWMELPEKRG
jgi:hypothetical protein